MYSPLFTPKYFSKLAIRSFKSMCDPSPLKRARNYTRSTRHGNGGSIGQSVLPAHTPPSYSWGIYAIPTALLGIVGAAVYVHHNDEKRSILKGQGKNNQENACKGPIIGGPFSLIDTEHQPVTEKDFMGKWVLLYFGYTSSPDVGPEQIQILAETINKLESNHKMEILPVFVTIDPQRDSPSLLRAYLREFNSRIVGLTGTVFAIRQMAQEYRVYFKKSEEEGDDYLVDSNHTMYLMTPKLEIVKCFGLEYNADEMSEAILKEVKRAQT